MYPDQQNSITPLLHEHFVPQTKSHPPSYSHRILHVHHNIKEKARKLFNSPFLVFTISLSIILYILSTLIVKFDTNFTYTWIALWIHVLSIIVMLGVCCKFLIKKRFLNKNLQNNEILSLLMILTLALVVSILFIQVYPYVNVGDGVRDSGLNALRIYNGTIKNIFGYGDYNGYGEIIPAFSSLFYNIFGSSVLTYRVPSAIISCIDTLLLYILLRFVTGKKITAFLGAAIYAVFPIHIFFARTELVLIFDSFWTSAMFLGLYLWFKERRLVNYILLGTILGVAGNFHTSARVVAVLIAMIVVFIDMKRIVSKVEKEKLKENIIKVIAFVIFCFVGFGPMILFSNSQTFFQSNRSILIKDANPINYSLTTNTLNTINSNYMKSLMVWFYEGTTSRYPEHKPLLPPLLALFFIIGLGYSFFVLKKPFLNVLILFVFLLPLTNSAMTDWVNADHRLAPLLTIGAIFISIGLSWIMEKINNNLVKELIVIVLFLYLFIQTYNFFTLLPANADKDIKDYLSMHIIYFLKSQPDLTTGTSTICLYVSPTNYQNLNYLHYKEQYEYFVPNLNVETTQDARIPDSEVEISRGDCSTNNANPTMTLITLCNTNRSFYCPLDYYGNIVIYY